MNKQKEKNLFKNGLLFVILAYICIKMIDQYHLVWGYGRDFLAITGPFILGAVFAYAINPLASYIEKILKGRRGLSILFAYLLVFLTIGIGFSFVVPVVYKNVIDLVNQIPRYIEQLQGFYTNNVEGLGLDLRILEVVKEMGVKFLPYLGNVLTSSVNVLVNIATNTISVTVNVFIGLFISYYMLIDKEKFSSYLKKLIYIVFREKGATVVLEAGSCLNANVGKYLVGKSIDSVFVAICAIVGMMIMGAQYSVLLGVIFGITNMVPYVGPIVGTAIAVGINLFTDPTVALIMLVYLLIVQQVESLIIDPKVVGKKLGLNPVFTILAVSIGGKYFGIAGMVLGAPIVGVIKMYAVRIINSKYKANYADKVNG